MWPVRTTLKDIKKGKKKWSVVLLELNVLNHDSSSQSRYFCLVNCFAKLKVQINGSTFQILMQKQKDVFLYKEIKFFFEKWLNFLETWRESEEAFEQKTMRTKGNCCVLLLISYFTWEKNFLICAGPKVRTSSMPTWKQRNDNLNSHRDKALNKTFFQITFY